MVKTPLEMESEEAGVPNTIRKFAFSSSFNKTGGITFTARQLCLDIESKYLCKMSRY
jgi:hypothetical protein